jgi:cold shock CspA family protein
MTRSPEQERLSGIVKRYHSDRGWGLIYLYPKDGAIPVKYFLHISQCINDTVPEVGVVAHFTPAPPRRPGDLPTAAGIFIGEMTVRYSEANQ